MLKTKVIQSFWSGNRDSLLNDSFGWLSPKHHIMGWCLSSNLLAKFYDVELYTDKVGYDLLIGKLKLPYSKVHLVMDDLNEYNNNLWALSKIYAYSLQEEPFLHIDGDVFIWEKFSNKLMQGNLISQNLESATDYYEKIMVELEKELRYFPNEILLDRKKSNSIYAYNAGIFGGNNIDFYKNYTTKAFEFVDKNLNDLANINITNFNIFFEQYLFYCLAKEQKVECYFNEVIEDNGYKGFGNFEDVPFKKNFLHLLGVFKRDNSTCRKMCQKLLSEFPQDYINVLSLFNKKSESLYSSILDRKRIEVNIDQINPGSFAKYFNQNSLMNKYSKTKEVLVKYLNYDNEKLHLIFTSDQSIELEVKSTNDQAFINIFNYEKKISKYLKNLKKVPLKQLLVRDLELEPKFNKFFSEKEDTIKEEFLIKMETVSTIITSPLLILDNLSLFNEDELSNDFSRMIIPEIEMPYYNEIILDELEEIIISELENAKTIKELLSCLEKYFDKEDVDNSKIELNELIYRKLKMLIYNKGITICTK